MSISSPPCKGRVALIAGASRGIGKATALELASRGYDIAFSYQSNEALAEQVRGAVQTFGVACQATRCDIGDYEAVNRWVQQTEQEMGQIEAAVNSAGITRDKPLALMGKEEWQAVLDTNLTGVFNLCRTTSLGMMKRRRGCIVNLSSVSGIFGNATQTNYAASKAGIIGFSKSLAKEIGPYGVRVNVVAPGLIQTDMTAKVDPARLDRMVSGAPLKRMGSAVEVARAIGFLCSADASYITAQVLGVDGGLVL